MYFLVIYIYIFRMDSRLANIGKEIVLLAFCLYCFNCGVVALSVTFFLFGVLDGKGNCIDS